MLNSPARRYRFDPEIELLDPWARAVTDNLWKRPYNKGPKSHQSGPSMRGLAVSENSYDWQGDRPLRKPCEQEIIYELHVGGFTYFQGSGLGRILADHDLDGSEPDAEYEDPAERFSKKFEDETMAGGKPLGHSWGLFRYGEKYNDFL